MNIVRIQLPNLFRPSLRPATHSTKNAPGSMAGVRKTVKEQLNYFMASVRRGW